MDSNLKLTTVGLARDRGQQLAPRLKIVLWYLVSMATVQAACLATETQKFTRTIPNMWVDVGDSFTLPMFDPTNTCTNHDRYRH